MYRYVLTTADYFPLLLLNDLTCRTRPSLFLFADHVLYKSVRNNCDTKFTKSGAEKFPRVAILPSSFYHLLRSPFYTRLAKFIHILQPTVFNTMGHLKLRNYLQTLYRFNFVRYLVPSFIAVTQPHKLSHIWHLTHTRTSIHSHPSATTINRSLAIRPLLYSVIPSTPYGG